MFRAMVEILGAFIANVPPSDDAAGRRHRWIAVTIVFGVILLAGLASQH